MSDLPPSADAPRETAPRETPPRETSPRETPPRRGLTRRQLIVGGSILAGTAALGTGAFIATRSPEITFAKGTFGSGAARVAVVYDSEFGSTGGLAEAAARGLAGLAQVDVWHMEAAPSLAGYDALVFGAPVQRGVMKASATTWLSEHASAVGRMPMAMFMPSASFGIDPDREAQIEEKTAMMTTAAETAGCEPVAILPTGGMVDFSLMSPLAATIYQLTSGSAVSGDYREPDAVQAWATEIAPLLGLTTS